MKNLPSVERLRERLSYDPASGELVWILGPRRMPTRWVGRLAGVSDGRYRYLIVDGCRVAAHRVALAMSCGSWPTCNYIDHKDGNGLNNRLVNLREASAGINQQNQRRAHRTNATGLLGVVMCRANSQGEKYRAQIWADGRAINLGTYLTAIAAHGAYLTAKRLLHPGCML